MIQCPNAHKEAFTQYAIGIYSCHSCNPGRKFYFNGGLPYWTDKPEPCMEVCRSVFPSRLRDDA